MIRSFLMSRAGKAESKVPSIILIIILGIGAFLGYKFIPVFMDHKSFENSVREALNWDRFYEGHQPPSVDSVMGKIWTAAKEYDIPLDDKRLKVENREGHLVVDLTYTQIIKLPLVGPYNWEFMVHEVQEK